METNRSEPELKRMTVILMITTAILFDFLQFFLNFLLLGWLVGIFAGLTFWFWFRTHGIKIGFSKPKRMFGFAMNSIVEMIPIPFLSSLPGWTIYVSGLALQNKIQELVPGADITKLNLKGAATGAARASGKRVLDLRNDRQNESGGINS